MRSIKYFLMVAFCVVGLLPSAQGQAAITTSNKGFIPADSLFKLLYVPVMVPAGIAELQVQLIYSDKGKNVLNLGIYGPEGHELGNTTGFRGWSGGAKTEFALSAQDASTGYVPGKIKPGTWHVLIYPSTILPAGIEWELAVTLVPGPDRTPFQVMPAPEAVNATPGWYHGDLHMHTLHSDGKRTQQQLVDEAVAQGLHFIVSTEHNTNSANLSWGKYASSNLLIINGEEVTTTAYGHWNALGLDTHTLIDWRYSPQEQVVAKYLQQVHADSGLAIINHAFYTKERTNGFGFALDGFDGIEVWNGKWDALDELALQWWDQLLRAGTRLLAVADSDTHTATPSDNHLGVPHTVVHARSLSRAGIMRGLRAGRAYLVAARTSDLTFTAKQGRVTADIGEQLPAAGHQPIEVSLSIRNAPTAVLTLYGDHGKIGAAQTSAASSSTHKWRVKPGSTKYVRVEARTPQGEMLALTNPIWL